MYDVLIMAGGESKRFGVNKALATFRGEPLIKRMLKNFRGCNVIVSVGTCEQLTKIEKIQEVPKAVVDEVEGIGPVEGLRVGLRECSSDVVFVVGCDHPFCSKEFANKLLSFTNEADAVIPCWISHQPMCAMYRRENVLAGIERTVNKVGRSERGVSILDVLEGLEIVFVDARLVGVPATLSFNTPLELAILEELNIEREIS
jgi:molybdopterin-guanine dinucleotide biosynthesis protein A